VLAEQQVVLTLVAQRGSTAGGGAGSVAYGGGGGAEARRGLAEFLCGARGGAFFYLLPAIGIALAVSVISFFLNAMLGLRK